MTQQAPLRISIIKPDDWHVHLRSGAILQAVLPYTANHFARALVMPNQAIPVTTSARAKAYRDEILRALPSGVDFQPLMTLYLTDNTDPDDLENGFKSGILTAAKYYPAHTAPYSEYAVTNIRHIHMIFERMQKIGMPLSVYGEITDNDVDVFDREAQFIERELIHLLREFPDLRVVLEHITTRMAVEYVADIGRSSKLAATITPHHLAINRNSMFEGGLRPHYYCLPLPQNEVHRRSLVSAATSGAPMFFLGTNSAPHLRKDKEKAMGLPGIFSSVNALELCCQIFADADCLYKLENFVSRNGAAFYKLPVNQNQLILESISKDAVPTKGSVMVGSDEIVPFVPPNNINWRVIAP